MLITNKPLLISGLAFHLGLPEEVIGKAIERVEQKEHDRKVKDLAEGIMYIHRKNGGIVGKGVAQASAVLSSTKL